MKQAETETSIRRLGHSPAVPLKLKKLPLAKCTNCSHLQWKLREISCALVR